MHKLCFQAESFSEKSSNHSVDEYAEFDISTVFTSSNRHSWLKAVKLRCMSGI